MPSYETLLAILVVKLFAAVIGLIIYIWQQHRKTEKSANRQLSEAIAKLSDTLEKMDLAFWGAINELREENKSIRECIKGLKGKCDERGRHCPALSQGNHCPG